MRVRTQPRAERATQAASIRVKHLFRRRGTSALKKSKCFCGKVRSEAFPSGAEHPQASGDGREVKWRRTEGKSLSLDESASQHPCSGLALSPTRQPYLGEPSSQRGYPYAAAQDHTACSPGGGGDGMYPEAVSEEVTLDACPMTAEGGPPGGGGWSQGYASVCGVWFVQ